MEVLSSSAAASAEVLLLGWGFRACGVTGGSHSALSADTVLWLLEHSFWLLTSAPRHPSLVF